MTSKDTIEIVIREYQKELDGKGNDEWLSRLIKGLKQVKRDIEVLDILKENHLELNGNNVYVGNRMDMMQCIKDYYTDMEEEYNKIKEFLENDK